jgi:hypothetical protein
VIPFAFGTASGVMRPVFLPDGSLLLGQTGRGWSAKGGSADKLQRIVYDGKTIPADLLRAGAHRSGFTVHFSRPLAAQVQDSDFARAWKCHSWFYTDGLPYGSAEHDKRPLRVVSAQIASDRMSAVLSIEGFGEDARWIDRIYHLRIDDALDLFTPGEAWKKLEFYYTLRTIPRS